MISHKKWQCFLLTCFVLFNIYSVNAEDITVNGTVVPGPCNVSFSDLTFNFEDLYSGNMDEAGSSSQWKNVDILLTDCPVGTQKVIMRITGEPSDDGVYFANEKDALNVVLQLTEPTHSLNYSNGSVVQTNVDSHHDASYSLAARIFSPQGSGSAGDFESVILLDFTYQ